MEGFDARRDGLQISLLVFQWRGVALVIKYVMKKHPLKEYTDTLTDVFDICINLNVITTCLDFNDFQLGYLVYPVLVSIYQLLSNSYLYYLFCLIAFSVSYKAPEIRELDAYQDYFRFIPCILLAFYFIAFPTFSLYSSVISAFIPLAYFVLLYKKLCRNRFKLAFQVFLITALFLMIGYYVMMRVNQERFMALIIDIGFVVGAIFTYAFALPEFLSDAFNNRPETTHNLNKDICNFADIEDSICIVGGLLSLYLAESILELLYSRVHAIYYLIIAYGYSSMLEIAYGLYHRLPFEHLGKAFYCFMVQLVLMKYIWVCFISPFIC